MSQESLWEKIKNWFLNFWYGEEKPKMITEGNVDIKKENNIKQVDFKNADRIEEKNIFIKNAKIAYSNYILNLDYYIGENIYNTIESRLEVNRDSIESLIEIRKENIKYEDIIDEFKKSKQDLENFKKTVKTEKIDNFLLSSFYVPLGIIGIETNDSKEIIKNIFKAITTRNSIIIIKDQIDEYSLENLLLIIVQEALNKFNVDNNIIQIVNKKDIEGCIDKFDLYIKNNGEIVKKEYKDKMYIYQEDDYFEEEVEQEIKRLLGNNVEVIKNVGLDTAIEKINKSTNLGVSIYSKDGKKAYKFINMINSKNVFFNGTLLNVKENEENKNNYYNIKNILCENILNKVS